MLVSSANLLRRPKPFPMLRKKIKPDMSIGAILSTKTVSYPKIGKNFGTPALWNFSKYWNGCFEVDIHRSSEQNSFTIPSCPLLYLTHKTNYITHFPIQWYYKKRNNGNLNVLVKSLEQNWHCFLLFYSKITILFAKQNLLISETSWVLTEPCDLRLFQLRALPSMTNFHSVPLSFLIECLKCLFLVNVYMKMKNWSFL